MLCSKGWFLGTMGLFVSLVSGVVSRHFAEHTPDYGQTDGKGAEVAHGLTHFDPRQSQVAR